MRRPTTEVDSPGAPGRRADVRCPVCGEPVRGIATASPGEHRFVGCDHYASGRFLRAAVDGGPAGPGRVRIGP